MLGALEEAFPLTDRELLHFARRKGNQKDGTTALLCIVAGGERVQPPPYTSPHLPHTSPHLAAPPRISPYLPLSGDDMSNLLLFTAHVGDCRAVMFRATHGPLPHRAPCTRRTADRVHHVWHR